MNMEQRVEILSPASEPDTTQRYLIVDHDHDEINLGDLIRKLWAEWKLMLAILLLGTFLSILAANFLTQKYVVETLLRAPNYHELGDAKAQTITSIEPVQALTRFTQQALTTNTHLQTLISTGLVEEFSPEGAKTNVEVAQQIFKNFSLDVIEHDYYQLSKDEKVPLREIVLSMETTSPELTVRYLQALIKTAKDEAVKSFSDDLEVLKATRITELNERIGALTRAEEKNRQAKIARLEEANRNAIANYQQQIDLILRKARRDRENQLIQLEEAHKIAASLNITEPVTWDDLRPARESSQITNQIGQKEGTNPLYFRGTRLLQAEIDRLSAREDDRPFAGGITELEMKIMHAQNNPEIAALKQRSDDEIYIAKHDELQQQLFNLLKQQTKFSNTRFAIVSQPPTVPAGPVRSPILVIAVGIVLAGFLAIFITLLVVSLRSDQEPSLKAAE